MKRFNYLLLSMVIALGIVACQKESERVKPSGITDIETEALPGQIKITWENQEPTTYDYIKVSYYDKLLKKNVVRLASSYSEGSITIPNTLQALGTYKFTLQPFSHDGTPGEVYNVEGTSGRALATVEATPVTLSDTGLFTDSEEDRDENRIAKLIDRNIQTIFHTRWSSNVTNMPHYIVVDLGEESNQRGFRFKYTTRNNNGPGNHPKQMKVYVSETFDHSGDSYVIPDINPSSATLVATLSGLPNKKSAQYVSDDLLVETKDKKNYRYVWFEVLNTHGSTKYFSLAELSIEFLQKIDPEEITQ